ncbi:MAG: hypothetical protein AAGG45_05955 [Pseudomonadota bacterium]
MRRWGKSFRTEDYDDWDDLPTLQTLSVRDVYRPIQKTVAPVIHTITICDIGSHKTDEMMDCDARAVIAPEGHEFYVSQSDIFLWTWPGYDDWNNRWSRDASFCADRGRANNADVLPATVFKFPIDGRRVEAVHTAGRPFDQFSLFSKNGRLKALVDWADPDCSDSNEEFFPAFIDIPESSFASTPRDMIRGRVTELPPFSNTHSVENRFTDFNLVYSNSEDSQHYPPGPDEVRETATLTIVDLEIPSKLTSLEAKHSVIRLERLNQDAVVTGYIDATGLNISLLDMQDEPRISSTVILRDRFESEGRSHAFNAMIDEDGSAVLGVPTVKRPEGAGRWWWNSDSSDVSFLSLDVEKSLTDNGALLASEADEHFDYDCEVSCIDWYGNSRPIFTYGRIFALSGTEIIEGQIVGSRIRELRRVNLTEPLPQVTADS